MTRWTKYGAAAILLPVALACAGDPPKVKEGLWEIRSTSTENPGARTIELTYRLCRNHAYDESATKLLKNVKGCNTVLKDVGGGKFSSASTCAVAGTTIISSGLTTYVSETATHSETHATYSPAFNGKTDETMTQDQQYVGDCPAGMSPGDMIDPSGVLRHHG